jgi:hypothetical protein
MSSQHPTEVVIAGASGAIVNGVHNATGGASPTYP